MYVHTFVAQNALLKNTEESGYNFPTVIAMKILLPRQTCMGLKRPGITTVSIVFLISFNVILKDQWNFHRIP